MLGSNDDEVHDRSPSGSIAMESFGGDQTDGSNGEAVTLKKK